MRTKKETFESKKEDAREFAKLLNELSESDKEKIKYIMIGLKMRDSLTA